MDQSHADTVKQASTPSTTRPSLRPHLLALLGYALLTALFYAPILSGASTFPAGDFTDHFLPFSLFQRSELLAGRLPLWNPYTYAGHPFLADVQAAVFYPLGNLALLLTLPFGGDAARLYGLQLEALLHFVLAGFFTYLLANSLLRRPLAAFLAGAIFVFSGYLTGYPALQLAVLRTAIWLPLVPWLLLRAFGQPERWRWWIGAGAAYAVAFLAGHPQTFLYLSYAVLAWIALLLAVARRRPGSMPALSGYVVRIGVFYAVFLGLSAAQLLPSLEFTRLSVRANAGYEFVSGGFPLSDTWQALAPGLVSFFSPLYVGLVALGLALMAVVVAAAGYDRRNGEAPADLTAGSRPFVVFFAGLALVAWLLSYGRNAFLFPLFYRVVPGWDLFQGQERAAYLVAFGLSLLAGFGAAALDHLSAGRRRGLALVYAALIAAGLAAFVLRYRATGQPGVSAAQVQQAVLMAAAVLVIFVVVLWIDRSGRWRLATLAVLVLAELFLTNRSTLDGGVPLAQQAAMPAEARAVQQAVQHTGALNAAWGGTAYQGPPGRVYNEFRAVEDYGMRAGAEDLWGSSPLRLRRYDALHDNFPLDRLWQLAGVQYVLSGQPGLVQPAEPVAELPAVDGATFLHRLDQPTPRAWIVHSVQSLEDAAALPLLGDARFDPAGTALLPPVTDTQGRAGFAGEGLLATPGQNSVRLEQLAPARLRLDVQSEHGGLLVIGENWLPGWQATVRREGGEAQPAPVVRADVTFLGVPVPSGRSTVELAYRPASVRLGLLLSAATLLALAVAVLWRTASKRIASPTNAPAGMQQNAVVRIEVDRARLATWLMAAVVLLAFALRVFRLGYQELRGDETFGYFFSLRSPVEIVLATLSLHEPHPVASYFVQHGWLRLAGHSEFALRFVSVWFGVLAVALLYRLGRRLGMGALTSTLAATLMAASPYAVWHSQDARMYTISLALTLASTWLALEVIRSGGRARAGLAYVLVSWLALHTHYFVAFVLVAQTVFVLGLALVDRSVRRTALRWLLYQVLLGLLYLPWLVVAASTLAGYAGAGDSPGFAAMLQRSLSVFGVGETVPAGQRTTMALLAGFLLLLGAVRLAWSGPQARRALFLLALYLAVPVLATWLSAQGRPIFNERYLIAAAPPFFLLLAAAVLGWGRQVALAPAVTQRPLELDDSSAGVSETVGAAEPGPSSLSTRIDRLGWVAAAALALLIAGALGSLLGFYTDPAYSKSRGWRELAAALERYSSGLPPEQVRLAQNFPDPTLWYYYDGPVSNVVLPPAANDPVRTAQEVSALVDAGVQRVVLPVQPVDWWDASGLAERVLDEQYDLVATSQVGVWPVQIYARPPAELPAIDVSFANGLRLAGAAVQSQRLAPGDALVVYLDWEGQAATLSGSEKVTLQLLDGSGKLAAQVDQPLVVSADADPPSAYAIQIPWLLPPGTYRLIAAVYDPAQPGAPRIPTAAGADHVELAVVDG